MNKEEDIRQAVEVMRRGGVILYPTDTIWGIGCDATNEEAVRRVYDIKKRDDSKALICLVDSDHRLQRYVSDVPNVAWDLIEYATRPLTIIFDKAKNLAPNLLAEDGSVGIRVTRRHQRRNKKCGRLHCTKPPEGKNESRPQQYHQTGFGRRSSHYQEISRKNHVRGKKEFHIFRTLVHLATDELQRTEIHSDDQLCGRCADSFRRSLPEVAHPSDTIPPDLPFRRHRFQRPLSGVSRHRYFPDGTVRPLRRKGRHQPRCHQDSLCHRTQTE